MHYDIIGDIHGHADALDALLGNLRDRSIAGTSRHADLQGLFVPDFIDRELQQTEPVDLCAALSTRDRLGR